MKQFKRFLTLVLAPMLLGVGLTVAIDGCKSTTMPLPAGAVNSASGKIEAQFNADLQAAHAAVVQYETDVKAGVHTPTSSEKTAVNAVIDALNVADPLEQAFHTAVQANPNAATPAELQSAMTKVSTSMTALQTATVGKVK